MTRNFFTLILRISLRNRPQAVINFVGLASGLFVSILTFLYVADELSYDRYHEKLERIYRVVRETTGEYWGQTSIS